MSFLSVTDCFSVCNRKGDCYDRLAYLASKLMQQFFRSLTDIQVKFGSLLIDLFKVIDNNLLYRFIQ